MNRVVVALIAGGLLVGLGVLAGQTGLLRFSGPDLPDFTAVEVEVSLPEEARIVAVEPISLDCRARVYAEVPVEGVREHRAFGAVYRTDRVKLDAVGDVDTCVDGAAAEVRHNTDGSTEVVIPGESIVFVRPRVDAVATIDSLEVDQGFIGELTDVFPGVDDDLGLTPLAYAYAQNVIGSSECMSTAYDVTEDILIDAYRQQLIDQGVDPDNLSVRIEGQPTFTDPPDIALEDGVKLSVGDGAVTCVASDDVGGVSTPSDV
ncbi:MAG: hypothetical protein AAGD35_14735 [Actinomycetota bacterium]